jgi:hypothetical protein
MQFSFNIELPCLRLKYTGQHIQHLRVTRQWSVNMNILFKIVRAIFKKITILFFGAHLKRIKIFIFMEH